MRGGCAFYLRNRGAPTYRALASPCTPAPTTPNYSQLGFRVHPPNPPQGGLSCSLLPAARHTNDYNTQETTAEMDWHRVVGPRGLCRPLDESKGFQQTTCPSRPVRAARSARHSKQVSRAGAGQGGQGRAEAGQGPPCPARAKEATVL